MPELRHAHDGSRARSQGDQARLHHLPLQTLWAVGKVRLRRMTHSGGAGHAGGFFFGLRRSEPNLTRRCRLEDLGAPSAGAVRFDGSGNNHRLGQLDSSVRRAQEHPIGKRAPFLGRSTARSAPYAAGRFYTEAAN